MSDNNNTNMENAEGISDSDIMQAMEEMSGYMDITLEDFREIYLHAYRHAHKRVSLTVSDHKKEFERRLPSGSEDQKPVPSAAPANFCAAFKNYFIKMQGSENSPPRVGLMEIGWSWAGAFLGIALVAYCNFTFLNKSDLMLLIGSFGASAVLIYGAIKSPLAQPRNLIGGHVLSAVIGVASYQCFSSSPWFASALAVATAIAVMHATKTLHPPGGATALIAVIGSEQIHTLGYLYALIPVGLGALMMLAVALVVNNIPHSRRYPEFWI